MEGRGNNVNIIKRLEESRCILCGKELSYLLNNLYCLKCDIFYKIGEGDKFEIFMDFFLTNALANNNLNKNCPFIYECEKVFDSKVIPIGVCCGNAVFGDFHNLPNGRPCPLKNKFLDEFSITVEELLSSPQEKTSKKGMSITVRSAAGRTRCFPGMFGKIVAYEKERLILELDSGERVPLGKKVIIIIFPFQKGPLI